MVGKVVAKYNIAPKAGGVSRGLLALTAPLLHTHTCTDGRHATIPEVYINVYKTSYPCAQLKFIHICVLIETQENLLGMQPCSITDHTPPVCDSDVTLFHTRSLCSWCW